MKPPAQADSRQAADLIRAVRQRTPARILIGRAGPAYRTRTQLALRRDHAAALDAVQAEIDLGRDFPPELLKRWGLFVVTTCADTKADYLLRPDLGRRLSPQARKLIQERCPRRADVQVAIGDGLSVAAVKTQVPTLLDELAQGVRQRGWRFGQPFVIRHCRVGVLNDIGEILEPGVVVLLIGERPGLATAQSLSAYMAYKPRSGHTDAERNLISNIHHRGVAPAAAGVRILRLVERLRRLRRSGVGVKEQLDEHTRLGPTEVEDFCG